MSRPGCPSDAAYEQMMADIQEDRGTRLGSGGFGEVYRIGDYVAKRVMIIDQSDIRAFNHETTVWAELSAREEMKPYLPGFCGSRHIKTDKPPPPELKPGNTNIATHWKAYERYLDEHSGKPEAIAFIFQKFEPVSDLHDKLVEWSEKPLPAEQGFTLINQIIMGFDLLHRAGYVHRDIKPANLLIRAGDLSPIIVDFGLVCKAPCDSEDLVGTMSYLPQNLLERNDEDRQNNVCQFPVKYKPAGFLQGLKQMMGCARKTRRVGSVKVKLTNTVATPTYNKASDRYAISLVLKHLISVIDWTGHEAWKTDALATVKSYRSQIVPFLAASVGKKRAGGTRRRLRR